MYDILEWAGTTRGLRLRGTRRKALRTKEHGTVNTYIVKGDICFSRSMDEIVCLEQGSIVVENGRVTGVFQTLPGALCRAAGARLRPSADPARHVRPACPRAAVRLPRARHGYGAAGVAQHLYLPGGIQIQGPGLRRKGVWQLRLASAAQHDHARGHLRMPIHVPCDGASYAESWTRWGWNASWARSI